MLLIFKDNKEESGGPVHNRRLAKNFRGVLKGTTMTLIEGNEFWTIWYWKELKWYAIYSFSIVAFKTIVSKMEKIEETERVKTNVFHRDWHGREHGGCWEKTGFIYDIRCCNDKQLCSCLFHNDSSIHLLKTIYQRKIEK